jgi:hypothetical protein
MKSSYEIIIQRNLDLLFSADLEERAQAMGARKENRVLTLTAFGAPCRITAADIHLDGQAQTGPLGVVLSLYGLNAVAEALRLEPFKAFKELPDSAPYVGAFASHTEQVLVPKVDRIMENRETIMQRMQGRPAPAAVRGDAAMVLQPLPRIALCYIFYAADEDFPASATCLYSHNAHRFMPVDGLADVAEYTSRTILALLEQPPEQA